METVTLKARVDADHKLIWVEPLPSLREGEVEVIVRYQQQVIRRRTHTATSLPVLDGRRYLGGTLRREEIYDDAR
jgi:hypothetical protein